MRFIASKRWFNAAWFQLCWFLAVLGNHAMVPVLLLLIALHLALHPSSGKELRMMLIGGSMGLVVDGTLTQLGVFVFSAPPAFVIPLWLLLLWAAFAATLRNSLSFLRHRPVLTALLGAAAGPLSYVAGMKLGAVSFTLPLPQILILLAAIWAIQLPLLMKLAALADPDQEECRV